MKKPLVILFSACCVLYGEAHALPAVIDNSAYPASASPGTNAVNLPASPSTDTLIELMARLEQLQSEVKQLTGKVEEQANQIAELKKHQSTMYSDLDERIKGFENKSDGTEQSANENTDATGAPADNVVDTQAAGAAVSEASPPAADNAAATPKPPDTPQVSDTEKQEYQQAYDDLRHGHTSQSITEFNAFLSKYPSGGLANNAQYWLGEAYRVNKDNDAARKAFNDVIEKYPGTAKVPDAILKLGYIEMEQKNPEQARNYFTRVTTDFPDSSAALLAAKKLLILNTSNR